MKINYTMSNMDANLIDFSSSDDMQVDSNWSTDISMIPLDKNLILSGRESIGNNPFDNVEKSLNNPFEAALYNSTIKCPKTDITDKSYNLLAFGFDENKVQESVQKNFLSPLENLQMNSTPKVMLDSSFNLLSPMDMSLINSSSTTDADISSTVFMNSPLCEPATVKKNKYTGLISEKAKLRNQSESDIIKTKLDKKFKLRTSSLDEKQIPSNSQNTSAKRTQLLKLSLANTPNAYSEPIVDDSFDDIMITNCQPKLIDSEPESDTDSEMKQFSIPFLKEIEKEEKKMSPTQKYNQCVDSFERIKRGSLDPSHQDITPPHNNNNDIESILENLKAKLLECELSEKHKILMNIKSFVDNDKSHFDISHCSNEYHTPPPIIRQGTFEVDKSESSLGSSETKKRAESVTFNPNISYSSTKPFRSKSLSLREKPISVVRAVQNKDDKKVNSNIINAPTPVKSMLRRSSFSTPSKVTAQPLSSVRKSILPPPGSPISKAPAAERHSLQPKMQPIKKLHTLKLPEMDFSKKLRSKPTPSTSTFHKTGPLRAINPAIGQNKVLKTPPSSNATLYKAANSSIRASTSSKLTTSPSARQSKSRLSYISATPNPKANKMVGAGNRRRSVSDYRNYAEPKSALLTPGKINPEKFLSKMEEMRANGTIYTRNKENSK